MHDDINLYLSSEIKKTNNPNIIKYEEHDKGHGRIEKRTCYVSNNIDWLSNKEQWTDLQTIIMVESHVTKNEKVATEQRYFISSLPPDPKQIAYAIRSHWHIENCLHWVLDVTLKEDESRIRKEHAPENMSMIRHIILNMLQNTKKTFKDMSIKRLQKKAGWGEKTLDSILMRKF